MSQISHTRRGWENTWKLGPTLHGLDEMDGVGVRRFWDQELMYPAAATPRDGTSAPNPRPSPTHPPSLSRE